MKELIKSTDSKYILDNKISVLFKIMLLFSWPLLGMFLSISDNVNHILISSFVIFIILIFIVWKININFLNKKTLLISFLIACYTDRLFLDFFSARIHDFQNCLNLKIDIHVFVALIIFPTVIFCIYCFVEKIFPLIIKEFKTITKLEKKFLLIVFLVAVVLTVGTSLITTFFQGPTYDGKNYFFDIVYNSDNGRIVATDSWTNFESIENDIRQPLFALFSLPISIPCHIISELLFFVPNDIAYLVVMGIAQFILLALTTIMLARLLKINDDDKKYFYCLFSLSFPYIMFGLVLEQYVIGLFYLIATVYYYYQDEDRINYLYLGAVGTMITSGILVSFITKYKGVIDWFKKIGICFATFVSLFILSGQITQLFSLKTKLSFLGYYTGVNLTFYDKMLQFFSFIQYLFLSPKGVIMNNEGGYISYQLLNLKSFSIVGIIIFIMVILSYLLNRKEKMALISIMWVFFSFVVLGVIGWGTTENGLILYSLYFAWAYYTWYYLLLNRIKNRKIFKILISISIVIIFVTMVFEMSNILGFALKYYIRW